MNEREIGDVLEFVHWASRTSADPNAFSVEAETKASRLLKSIQTFLSPTQRDMLVQAWSDHRNGGPKDNFGKVADKILRKQQAS